MADKQTLELLIKVIASEAAKQVRKISGDFKELGDKAKNASKGVKESLDGSDGLSSALKTVKNELSNLAAVAAAVKIDKTVGSWAVSALEVSSSFQGIKDEFGIMLHDVEAGAAFFDELQQFNFWTPFDIETTSKAAKVLYSAKVPLGEITDYLTRFGDIAQGDSQKFDSFIRAFSKASAKGKADMEVLNVFTDQGVQILDELGKQFNVTSAEIVDMASKGEISFQALDAALESMASEGGLYFGTLEKASQRLDSVYAGLQESTKSLAASLGDTLAPLATKLLTAVTDIVDAINDSPLLKGVLVAAITAVVAAVNLLAGKALVVLIAKLWATFTAQMAANSAMAVINPTLLAGIAAVTVAVGAYTAYAASQRDAASASEEAALAAQKANDAISDVKSSYDDKSSYQIMSELAEKSREIAHIQEEINSKNDKIDSWNRSRGASAQKLDEYQATKSELDGLIERQKELNSEIEVMKQALSDKSAAAALSYQAEQTAKFTTELENAKAILDHRDKLYGNTQQGQLENLEAELKFAKDLLTLQTVNEDGSYTGFNVDKTNAIITELEKKISDLKANMAGPTPPAFTEDWVSKNLEGIAKITAEEAKAKAQLAEKAKASFGDEYATREEYITQLGALEEYYANQVAEEKKRLDEEERERILNQHQERLNQAREEFEYQRELARQAIENGGGIESYAAYAGNSAKTAISNTDLFSTIIGANPIIQLIEALIEALVQIESINKILNWAHTIINSMMEVLEPIIDQIFKPIADLLEEIGRTIGYILAPVLNAILAALAPAQGVVNIVIEVLRLVGKVFQWLNNHVIVPFGNAVIDIVNGIIGLINLIPGVDIKKVEKLQIVGEMAEELADAMEKATEECKKKYERQKDAVEDLLSAQINSLKSQYELGLITREQYNTQTAAYRSAADEELVTINEAMLAELKLIEEYTKAGLTPEQAKAAEEAAANGTQTWYEMDYGDALADKWSSAGTVASAAGQLLGDIADVVTAPIKWIADLGDSWGWWDVGSTYIPKDQFGMVHHGEAIIPRTFAEGIRSGDMALVGGKSSSSSQPFTVVVNVGGSVVTERQIVDVVYDGIARAIGSGEKSPLPGAA